MDAEDVWKAYRWSPMMVHIKPEGGWFIGPVSTPYLSGPPGTKPQDHPDYLKAKEYYGF